MEINAFGEFYAMLRNFISDENFNFILNARKESLINMSKVSVTVPTEIKLLGVTLFITLDFDGNKP